MRKYGEVALKAVELFNIWLIGNISPFMENYYVLVLQTGTKPVE